MDKILITGQDLSVDQIVAVCRERAVVELSAESREAVLASRKIVDDLVAEKQVVYGITTGFGKFSDVVISTDECKDLQKNLIITHAVGAGDPFPEDVARGMLLLRINNLSKGYSGIRLETLETMIAMLNKGVTPFIPEKGSLGASGDLAPLSHMVLVMLGLGKAYYEGELLSGAEAMKRAGIPVIELSAKEGLALNNGTQAMTAVGALALHDAKQLLKIADIADALCFEAQNGVMDALEDRVHAIRPHEGQGKTAKNLRRLLADSKNTTRQGEIRVQDAYSLRCSPQIHGASKDAVKYVQGRVDIEINSVTDNPLIFKEDRAGISGGNFHGQPMALPFDFLKIAEAELANVCLLRLYDCAVLRGGSGLGEQGARTSGERGQHPELGGPGGPCQHGYHCGASGGGNRQECAPCPRDGAHGCLPGHRYARQQGTGTRHAGGIRPGAQGLCLP